MFKKGYKIILIKDGQFDLKEFRINPIILSAIVIAAMVPIFLLISYINGFYNSNINELLQSQTQKMEILEFSVRGWQDALNFISQIGWNFDNDINNIRGQ